MKEETYLFMNTYAKKKTLLTSGVYYNICPNVALQRVRNFLGTLFESKEICRLTQKARNLMLKDSPLEKGFPVQ